MDAINTYKSEDVFVIEITNEEFAKFYDFVVAESFEAGWSKHREAVELGIREQERTKGKLHCIQDACKRLDEARGEDNAEGKPKFGFRNVRRCQIAKWKQYCT